MQLEAKLAYIFSDSTENILHVDVKKRSGSETSPNDESLYSEIKIWVRAKLSFNGNRIIRLSDKFYISI